MCVSSRNADYSPGVEKLPTSDLIALLIVADLTGHLDNNCFRQFSLVDGIRTRLYKFCTGHRLSSSETLDNAEVANLVV